MNFPKDHPIWSIARLALYLIAMCVVLWVNCKSFDADEIKNIVSLFMTGAGIEGGVKLLKRFTAAE